MDIAAAVYELVNHAWRQFGGKGKTDVVILRQKGEKQWLVNADGNLSNQKDGLTAICTTVKRNVSLARE